MIFKLVQLGKMAFILSDMLFKYYKSFTSDTKSVAYPGSSVGVFVNQSGHF